MIVWHDGAWLEESQASRNIADRGGLLGDGLFETMRVCGGQLVRGGAHAARLLASCRYLGLNCPIDADGLQVLVAELVRLNELSEASVRLTLTAGSAKRGLARSADGKSVLSLVAHIPAERPQSVSLHTSAIRRSPSSPATSHKTLSYIDNIAARREAQAAGADMALMLDTAGNLSGADCANLFWIADDQLCTPALDCGVLRGTLRDVLAAGLSPEEGRFQPHVLQRASLVFLTNALMGLVPVDRIDGHAIESDADRLEQLRELAGERAV